MIPQGGVRPLQLDGNKVILSRRGATVAALPMPAPISVWPSTTARSTDGIITCPYHGFRYDLASGECLTAPEVQLLGPRRPRRRRAGRSASGPLMRVSLAPRRMRQASPQGRASRLLAPEGARVVLGGQPALDGLAAPIAPAADTLFGCRGACLATRMARCSPAIPATTACCSGARPLRVTARPPTSCSASPLSTARAATRRGEVGAATLNVPTGVAAGAGVIAVADAWNHRVLIWHGVPERSARQPADLVLGQADFTGELANRGADRPVGATLNWCYGVAIADGRLWWPTPATAAFWSGTASRARTAQPADLVLGQRDFDHPRRERRGCRRPRRHALAARAAPWPPERCWWPTPATTG